MAQMLTQKDSIAKKRGMSPDVAKALARLSSGLYVVTASNNSARGAMVSRALYPVSGLFCPYSMRHICWLRTPHNSCFFPTHTQTKSLGFGLTVSVYCRHSIIMIPCTPMAGCFVGEPSFI